MHKLLGLLVKAVRSQAVFPTNAALVQMTVGAARSNCLAVHVEAHLTRAIKTTGIALRIERPLSKPTASTSPKAHPQKHWSRVVRVESLDQAHLEATELVREQQLGADSLRHEFFKVNIDLGLHGLHRQSHEHVLSRIRSTHHFPAFAAL